MVESPPENLIKITNEQEHDSIIKENKIVLVGFNANWCPPCKKVKPQFVIAASNNPTIKILDIDVDVNRELTDKFSIKSIPTLFLYIDGKKIKECVGWDENFIPKEIKKIIPDYKYK